MKIISKIEPKMPALPTRKKVAAYARVSMETERLKHSLSAQISFYSSLIQKNPLWEYVGVYADDGISGTGTEKREEFNRMLADCNAGKIDIVLTKSISRFARNTLDILETVRHLKEIGVEVRFEKERINSLSEDGELMLTLLASFAQEESRSLSENVKWGTRKRFEKGIPNGKFKILGYVWEGDHLVIEPDGATIVKRIFQNFLDGKSRIETEKELDAEGLRSIKGNKMHDSQIKAILTNITYTGNLLFQKEYVVDPITKKSKLNHGELPQYFVADTHEPIIDMETYEYVQAEMKRRKGLGPFANKSLNITCFTSKIRCGGCSKNFQRSARSRKRDSSYKMWICSTRRRSGNAHCLSKDLPEDTLKKACAVVLNLEEFDESVFSEQVDYIIAHYPNKLEFHFYDGRNAMHEWISTAHKDCWTPERRAAKSESMKKEMQRRKEVKMHGKDSNNDPRDNR